MARMLDVRMLTVIEVVFTLDGFFFPLSELPRRSPDTQAWQTDRLNVEKAGEELSSACI